MDLRITSTDATSAERAVVDRLVANGPGAAEDGPGTTTVRQGHRVVRGGPHRAKERRHLLLPALHALQSEIGWVSPGGLGHISEALSVPPAEAYGVATFYHLIATDERPSAVAHLCDDIACRNSGATGLIEEVAERLGADRRTAWATSPCLGRCEDPTSVFIQRAGAADTHLSGTDVDTVIGALDDPSIVNKQVSAPLPQGIGSPDLKLLRRVGVADPTSLDDYRRHGGYASLREAIRLGPAGVIREVTDSGLLGRGGAAFPTGVKWSAVAGQPARHRYLVANADESEPGTFKDRVVMEHDPFALVEAMTVAGFAVGAETGYLYIRGEYPLATARLSAAIDAARHRGLLGADVMGAGFSFDIELRRGAGAYICGEETALFNSIEGFRGEPRNKPPYPTTQGLFGQPTAVNNVETLINVLDIVTGGAEAFAAVGIGTSAGTRLFCVSGSVTAPGLYEYPFGITLGELLAAAGGVRDGRDLRAVLLGGAAGSFVGPDALDLPLTFQATRDAGVSLGSGVVMVFDDRSDMTDITNRIARFFREESCGQCVPCRVGTVRQAEVLTILSQPEAGRPEGDHSGKGRSADEAVNLLDDLALVMADASICGLGHTASGAIRSALALGLIGVDR